jgi:hypothetical protein
MRAERKIGQLLKETAATGERRNASEGRPTEASTDARLSDWGISWDQSSKWQRVGSLPDDEFEAALADGVSTSDLVEAAKIKERGGPVEAPEARVSSEALWLWGELERMERERLLGRYSERSFSRRRASAAASAAASCARARAASSGSHRGGSDHGVAPRTGS